MKKVKKDNLCVICNYNKGYYPVIYPGTEQNFYECYKYDILTNLSYRLLTLALKA